MPRQFFHTTAELTIRAVEAVHSSSGNPDISFVETFCDLSNTQASEALGLAVDLAFISEASGQYSVSSPLAQFLSTPKDPRKASILRIALESYDVFLTFRERLFATGSADNAAQQTKTIHDLDQHREDIKDTLISLGTYSGAIVAEGGGQYSPEKADITDRLSEVASGCADAARAESWIRKRLGTAANKVSRDDVIIPLASAIVKAVENNTEDAVTEAGSAFESYLVELAGRMGVNLSGASGINSKLDKFKSGGHLPKKIAEAAKYIGQVRNAAGHGVDPDTGATWVIQASTCIEIVFVVCSLISACNERESSGPFIL